MDKRNFECFNCEKKGHFKSECQAKPKDQTDYRNIRFLESEQPEIESITQLRIYGGLQPTQLLVIWFKYQSIGSRLETCLTIVN